MRAAQLDIPTLIPKIDKILKRGLCPGVGTRGGLMCIEAALCYALDLPHGDDPGCVPASVRYFKLALNDSQWSSPIARAKGLRDLGIAQLGSKEVVDSYEFSKRISEATIKTLIPKLFRTFSSSKMLAAANRCEKEGTAAAAAAAVVAAQYAADAAAAKTGKDEYLLLSASIALQILKDLKSPGAAYV